jgi:hypothetical protein
MRLMLLVALLLLLLLLLLLASFQAGLSRAAKYVDAADSSTLWHGSEASTCCDSWCMFLLKLRSPGYATLPHRPVQSLSQAQ